MLEQIQKTYRLLKERCDVGRKKLGRPLTLSEKILLGHVDALDSSATAQALELVRKQSNVGFRCDRVAMQDATAQMALLQFMHAGMSKAAVPSTVHCDHLIRAHSGAASDLNVAQNENREVYDFLKSVSARYGIGFWEPGAGIIHQVVLENYAFPGGMMIGTDSHTPNAGGLGMIAVGVGGADAVDVMVGEHFGLKWPGVIGVHLKGALSAWTSPKDVILALMGILTVKGGTGHIVEFFGEGARSISCTGKGTICNMGAEHGATTSIFPYDERMAAYLRATGRSDIAELADANQHLLQADKEVLAQPEKYFDRVIEIDLSTLEPHLVGPHSPDVSRPISQMARDVKQNDYPVQLRYTLIGSCTNSSYEDIERSADLAKQAQQVNLKINVPLMVTPGSTQIEHTIERDGQMATLKAVGATVLANACGPCIGQWKRDDIQKGDRNSILTSYNRNFKGRNDGNDATMCFIGSPEIVTAIAFSGRLDFNPLTDRITLPDGSSFQFKAPKGDELPKNGFVKDRTGFVEPPKDGSSIPIVIDKNSKRLQQLAPFAPWEGRDYTDLVVLMKAKGKCTTDHISAAGPWLRFRGHLENISDNMFLGAINAFTDETGRCLNVTTDERGQTFAQVARNYKSKNIGWVAFGDENYGEGSSREHAAMSPRYLGGKAIIVRSFARIHETNLKKQGILPLTFVQPQDYDKVQERDKVAIKGLTTLTPGKNLIVELTHQDGTQESFEVKHTLNQEQIEWFKAGSALNQIALQQRAS